MKKNLFTILSFIHIIFLSNSAFGMVDVTLLDETFVRGTETPVEETKTFPGKSGTAVIKLINGNAEDSSVEKVSSSIIKINGVVVFDSSNFNQNVSSLENTINLNEGDNTVSVLLKSKPGGQIGIQIVQEIDADGADVVGEEGGLVEVTDPESPIYGASVKFEQNILNGNEIVKISQPSIVPPEPNGTNAISYPIEIECESELNGTVQVTLPIDSSINDDDYILAAHYEDSNTEGEIIPILNTNFQESKATLATDHFSIFIIVNIPHIVPDQKDTTFNLNDDCFHEGYKNPYNQCYGMSNFSIWYFLNNYEPSLRCAWDKAETETVVTQAFNIVWNDYEKVRGAILWGLYNADYYTTGQKSVRDYLIYSVAVKGEPTALTMCDKYEFNLETKWNHSVIITGYKKIASDDIVFYYSDPNAPTQKRILSCKRDLMMRWYFSTLDYPQYKIFFSSYVGDNILYSDLFQQLLNYHSPDDMDADTIGDRCDNCPSITNVDQNDFDMDTIGDACDIDDDNDGVNDEQDIFPFDPSEWSDTDSDGIGDNADLDDDNDGVDDDQDAFPFDPDEWSDFDSDGIGDNADLDDDNDGVDDNQDDFPNDPSEWSDTDSDGVGDNADCDDNDPNEFPGQVWYKDTDGDNYSDGIILTQCLRPTNYKIASELIQTSGDCNDNNPNAYPDANEVCGDGVDNDCDSHIDEECGSTLLFQDDFNDGVADGWNESTSNWSVENGEYSVYLSGRGLGSTTFIEGSENWSDYILEFDAIRKEGVDFTVTVRGCYFTFRTGWYWDGGHNYYFLNGTIMGEFTFPLGVWHKIRIECIGNNVKFYIKQEQQSDYILLHDLSNSCSYGQIGFWGWSGDRALTHFHVDNVTVNK